MAGERMMKSVVEYMMIRMKLLEGETMMMIRIAEVEMMAMMI